jgi:N-acetylmuramoyl-L-alanine amidase
MKKFILVLFVIIISATAFAQRTNLSGLKFCIDPGHGGNNPSNDRWVVPDPGTNFWESESNFEKALLLKPLLEEQGAWVILTRYTNNYPTDAEPSLQERYEVANANNVTWFHSIHSNASGVSPNLTTNVTMVLLKENIATRKAAFPQAVTMSDIIGKHIVRNLRTGRSTTYLDYTFYGGDNGGYNLGVLKGTLMPAELSEGSFHDFYPETRRLMNNYYHKMEAYAIRNAFMEYFGVPADTLCIIAGIIKDMTSQAPINNLKVRLIPGDSLYTGDAYNNGFYMFDKLRAGQYKLIFEAPGYVKDSAIISISTGEIKFFDKTLLNFTPPVASSNIIKGDTTISVTSYFDFSFTKVMDTASVRAAFSFTPKADGAFTWSNSNMSLRFTPFTPLASKTIYIIKIDTSAKDIGGFKIDGNGDGISGDTYTNSFKTLISDDERPFVLSSYPAKNSTLKDFSTVGTVTITFNKIIDTTSLKSSISLRKNSIDVPSDLCFYSSDNRTIVTLKPKSTLDTNALYVLIVNNTVKDLYQNTMKAIYYFYVNTSGRKYKQVSTIESFASGIGNWWQPTTSGSTVGVTPDKTTLSLDSSIFYPFAGDKYAAKLNYSFTPGATPNLIREYLSTGTAYNTLIDTSMLLQSFVFGDNSKNQIRFCIDDSSTFTKHRVSAWVTIDWFGWKLIEWKFGNFSEMGSWLNPGPVVGPKVRFDSYQISYDPLTGSAEGSIYLDELRVAELEKNVTVVDESPAPIPNEIRLAQNYPNPFNPSTTIRFNLPERSRMKLVVYDLLGREVSVLKNDIMNAGTYSVNWNASNMPSGVYFAKLYTETKVSSIKMILTK